jgi:hypothetical protein
LGVIGVYLIRSAYEGLSLSGWTLFIPLAALFMALSIAVLGMWGYVQFVVVPQTLKSLMAARVDPKRRR